MSMTIEQVRDWHRQWAKDSNMQGEYLIHIAMADAIDAHLSQPQPVAQGDAVGYAQVMPGSVGFTMAVFHAHKVAEGTPLYITTIPTGHRVVPVVPTESMVDAAWAGDAADYVGEHKVLNSAEAVWEAMLAAAPDAGGV